MERLGTTGWLLLLSAVTGLVLRAWGPALDWGFTDGDAWADVAWARHPLSEQLLTPLTGGVGGANANFWRPAAMIQFWIQRRLFGWEAAGWHAWDLGMHVIASMLLAAFVDATTRRRTYTVAAALLFATHPLADEVVPAVARNLDLLLGVGVFGALWGLAARRPGVWWLGLVLALGAKEAGVLVPLWTVGWVLLFRVDRAPWPRIRLAAAHAGVATITLAAWWALRSRVIPGVGGYFAAGEIDVWAKVVYALQRAPVEPLLPGLSRHLGAWPGPVHQGVLAAAGIGLLGWLLRGRDRRLVAFGLLLWAPYVLLLGLTGTYTRRVLYVPTAGALLVVLVALSEVWRRRSAWGGVIAAAWVITAAAASPVFVRYRDWGEAARAGEVYRTEALCALPAGVEVWLVDRPYRVDLDPRKDRLWSNDRSLTHTPVNYAIQAWVDEVCPGRRVHTASAWVIRTPLAEQSAVVSIAPDGVHVVRSGGVRRSQRPDWVRVTADELVADPPPGAWLMVWVGDHLEVIPPGASRTSPAGGPGTRGTTPAPRG